MKFFARLFFVLFLVVQTSVCFDEMSQSRAVIVDETIVFHTKRWKKPREAFVFLVKHQREFPMMLRVALVLSYKKLRGQKLSVPVVLKEFRELQRYKDEIYNFIALEDPCDEVVELLKLLKLQGIKIVFTTTMMKESLDYNKELYREIFELFDQIVFVPAIQKSKSDKEYYFLLANLIDSDCVLLVDTKKECVDLANQKELNMQGLLFSSAEHLEKNLIENNYLTLKGFL